MRRLAIHLVLVVVVGAAAGRAQAQSEASAAEETETAAVGAEDAEEGDGDAEASDGDAALAEGRYDEALAAYRERLASRPASAALHYNMGLAAAHGERLGLAAFHLTQARFLEPGAADIQGALALVETAIQRGLRAQTAGETLTRGEPEAVFWLRFFNRLPASAADLVLIAGSWLGFGLLLWRRRRPPGGARDAAFVVALLSLLVALHALGYRVGGEVTRATVVPGVVVATDPMLSDGPDLRAAQGGDPDLFEGALVRIREERPEWMAVELANGRSGWLSAQAVRRVVVPPR